MSSEPFPERENPIGDYLLNEEIGSGGFAKVVQGIHIPTGEKVAVKIMPDADHNFTGALDLFISLPEKYLFGQTEKDIIE